MSRRPAHRVAAGRRRPAAADPAGSLRLYNQSGCPLCDTGEAAVQVWLSWFRAENHGDQALLRTLRDSAGFCPVHTRRLLAEAGPQVLRRPLASAVEGAISQAQRLTSRAGRGRWQRRRPPAPCPLCRMTADRERAAAGDVAAILDEPGAVGALADRRGLCRMHLGSLLPLLSPAQAAVAAEIAARRLAALPAGVPETLLALAGQDADALARLPYLEAHARVLYADSRAAPRTTAPGAAGSLIADLAAGSCPPCHAAGREQVRYLLWLGDGLGERGPAETDLRLCAPHLYDAWHLYAARAAARTGSWLVTAVARGRGETPDGTPADVALPVTGDRSCRACWVGLDAERRQLNLLSACLQDTRVVRAVGDAHGLCLRHAAVMTADASAGPVLSRLVTQLRQAQWELDEDAARRAWDRRHEPRGREQDAWRRAPALIDGAVYLGCPDGAAYPSASVQGAVSTERPASRRSASW